MVMAWSDRGMFAIAFDRRVSRGSQRCCVAGKCHPGVLGNIKCRPSARPLAAIGGICKEACSFIRALCMRHCGEVRELRGPLGSNLMALCPGGGGPGREILNPQLNGRFIRVS